MDDLTKEMDELNLSQSKTIQKHLSADESIRASFTIFKYNEYKNRQERTLMITNKAIYNLKNHSIKRVIPFNRVAGLTVACFGTEFVIHVPTEYDYRYSSLDRMEIILFCITSCFVENQKKKLPFYFKDEISLVRFWTSKADSKNSKSMMPQEPPQLLDEASLRDKFNNLSSVGTGQMVLSTNSTGSVSMRQNNFSQPNMHTPAKSQTIWTNNEKRKDVCLDDFQLLKVLGGGAFEEWFAMKVIKKQVIVQNGKFEHTKTEKQILEHVNFPFLVNLVYAFQDSQRVFFVMQFLKGGELYQCLKRDTKFTESRTQFYIASLVLALGHLHSKHIIYRDLKLENIVMDSQGFVCLTDFGLAKKFVHDSQIATTFCGTAEYLSPEILNGEGQDYTADWWALGIICYELLHGSTPFYNRNPAEMFKHIKASQLTFKPNVQISPEAKDFIERCLEKDKRKRLGVNGQAQVQGHPWFAKLDWNRLLKKELTPEFIPVTDGLNWVGNFNKDFTKLTVRITNNPILDPKTTSTFEELFKDF